jgi:hypothetical protein
VIRSWTNRKGYSGNRVGKVLLASVALVAIGAATAFAASIPNGNFEEGNFSGWKKQSKGDGTWFVYTAKNRKVPGPGGATLPKPFGKYAAALKQSGPGTNYLTHTFTVVPRNSMSFTRKAAAVAPRKKNKNDTTNNMHSRTRSGRGSPRARTHSSET